MFDPDRPPFDGAVQEPQSDAVEPSPWPAPSSPPMEADAPRRKRRRPGLLAAAAALAVVATGIGVSSIASLQHGSVNGTDAVTSTNSAIQLPSVPTGASTTVLSADAIVAKVDPAVVDITTTIPGGEAAGTGMVLTSSGVVLTNNHVIADATSIEVQIQGTGTTYSAHVLGYDVTDDVAVLQLDGATNVATITVGDSSSLQLGDLVVAIGNALGAAGPHAVSTGAVDALDQTVMAGNEAFGGTETLNGLIETSASLQPGDSGGVLVDSSGAVVGMNTIGTLSDGRFGMSSSGDGYAIPIEDALTIARQIVAGQSSSTVHVGDRAILGIEVSDQTWNVPGALVAGVEDRSPAASAGLQAGDTITAIDGTALTSISDLQSALADHGPGDHVDVTWVGLDGGSQTATITLIAGPPA
jgi:S1-C subfamily serine protease